MDTDAASSSPPAAITCRGTNPPCPTSSSDLFLDCSVYQLPVASKIGRLARSGGGVGAGAGAGDGGGGGRPAGAHGDPRQGRLHLRLPQRRHRVAVQGTHHSSSQQLLLLPFAGGLKCQVSLMVMVVLISLSVSFPSCRRNLICSPESSATRHPGALPDLP